MATAYDTLVNAVVADIANRLAAAIPEIAKQVALETATATHEKLQIRELKPVMSFEETCEALHISTTLGRRLKKHDGFPVAPMSPAYSSRDLYSGEDVIAAIRSRGWWGADQAISEMSGTSGAHLSTQRETEWSAFR